MQARRTGLGFALLLAAGALGASTGCGGAPTRLVTVQSGTGQGPIQFEVKNLTSVGINNFYLAPSSQVTDRLDPDSPEGQAVWGADLLVNAIAPGDRVAVSVAGPGRWEARAVDRDRRYQHVAGLKLEAGGRYILELNDGGWRVQP